ncbi:MAG: tetratricopeptide repeat protein, partial [Ignavibacteriae bacterium]|nr:tetratricopeptide repeat protein [Ignavibacteriota bacterium]
MFSIRILIQNICIASCAIIAVCSVISCGSNSVPPKRIITPSFPLSKYSPKTEDSTSSAKKAKDYVIRGSSLQMREQYAEAILEFQMALRYDSSAVIYYTIAKNYASLSKYDMASEYARIAVEKDSDFVSALVLLADIYLNSDHIDDAITLYEKIVLLVPESNEYKFALAQSLEIRNPDRAAQLYNELLINEDDEATLYTLSQLYKRNKEYDKYLHILERLYTVNSDPRVGYMLMNGYLRQMKFDNAIEFSEKLEQVLPSEDTEEYFQAISSTLLDNTDSILFTVTSLPSYLEKLNNRHSFDWRYYYGNGILASRIGNSALASTFFNKALERDTTIELPLRLAAYYLQGRNYDMTVTLLKGIEKNFPFDARIPLYIGIAYSGSNDYGGALPYLQRAITLD